MKNQNAEALMQALLTCTATCETCATACLNETDVKMMTNCIKLDRDCADICSLAVRLIQRDSFISREFLLICERICHLCATECSKHTHEHCLKCAEACKECAHICHQYHKPIHQA